MTDHHYSPNLFFTLPPCYSGKEPGSLRQWLHREAEQLLGLHRCAQLYRQIETTCGAGDFSAQALKKLGVSCEIDGPDQARIPAAGP